MLQRVGRFVRGWVEVEITGAAPEGFFNRCARAELPFWDLRRQDPVTWRCKVDFFHYRKASEAARAEFCQLRVLGRGGIPGGGWKLRRRWGFWAGMVLALGAIALGSNVILGVEVSGNVTVPTGKILTQLKAQGVKVGAFGPGLDVGQASHGVLLAIPELSWMSINLKGTVAEVLVREGRPRPELLEEDIPADIVAKYSGIITRVRATSGDAVVQKGDTVAEGDILIRRWVDFVEPAYFEGDMGGMTVRATGQVWARTWHTLKAAMPLTQESKTFTGAEKKRFSLEILGKEVKFYGKGGIPYEKYAKIVTYHRGSLPFGVELPVALKTATLREYTLEEERVDDSTATELLKAELLRQLETVATAEEIRKTDFQVRQANGLLEVTLLAECEREIGVTVEDPATKAEERRGMDKG